MSKREKRRKATVESIRARKAKPKPEGRLMGLSGVLAQLHNEAEQAATDLQVSLGMIR